LHVQTYITKTGLFRGLKYSSEVTTKPKKCEIPHTSFQLQLGFVVTKEFSHKAHIGRLQYNAFLSHSSLFIIHNKPPPYSTVHNLSS
jgi:hypothetical protein